MKKIYATWPQIEEDIAKLAEKIKKANIKFDGIYGVPRGGLPLAVILSHELDLPILLHPTTESLVVDDISDTGLTLQHIKNKKIATIYNTEWTVKKPDWHIRMKESKESWIVFPWEKKE